MEETKERKLTCACSAGSKTRRTEACRYVEMSIRTSCIILAVLAVIFGELIWYTDLMLLRGIVAIPLVPIAMLLSHFELYGIISQIVLQMVYLTQWTTPVIVLWLLLCRFKLRESIVTKRWLTTLALTGSALFLTYMIVYISFRMTGMIEFKDRIVSDHGGWGSGKTYVVCQPIIKGPGFFNILYPLASFEGNCIKPRIAKLMKTT